MGGPSHKTEAAVERFGHLVLKVAWRVLPDAEEVRDIFQETFLQFHRQMQRGAEVEYPKAWLCRTALHAACRRVRQKRREALCEGDMPAARVEGDKEAEQQLMVGRVRQLAAELPERQREVFVLRNFQGLSFAEIAAQVGCSEEAARANEYKALKKMRAWLGGDWKE